MEELRQLLRGLEVFAGELPVFDPVATPDTPSELFMERLRLDEATAVAVNRAAAER
ncbi:hypothetical protein [Streptomyces sp. NPDC048309]|uniref:hypothetical protein n=1 Tax=unclassified Streptomyces TaxID=2593676 RepID=UPI00340FD1D9